MAEAILDAVIIADKEGAIRFANQKVEQIFGYSQEELLNKPVEILIPARFSKHIKYRKEYSAHPHLRPMGSGLDLFALRKDGSEFPVEVSLSPLSVDRTTVIVAIIRDITKRKEYENALRTEKARFSKLAETAPGLLGSFRLKPDGSLSVPYASPACQDIFGFDSQSLADDFSPVMDRIHPDDVERVTRGMEYSAKTLSPWQIEIRYDHPAKGKVWLEGHLMPLPDSHGNVIWHGFILDITERKRSELAIMRQADYLKALRKIDLAISNSLDIRIVLNVILNEVSSQLKCDACDIFLLNKTTRALEFASGYGFRFEKQTRSIQIGLGDGIAGRVALQRKLFSIPDLTQPNDDVVRKSVFEQEGFRTYLGVPLIAKGELQGVLEVFLRSPYEPDDEWMDFLETLAGQAAIAIDNATLFRDLKRSNQDLVVAYDKTLEGWSAALDLRDEETEGHTQRVTSLTLKIAQKMGFGQDKLVHVRRGSLLHDIGKMGVPDNILLKSGELTDEEWAIMRKHAIYAYDLLKRIPYLNPALEIPRYHHERWDGSGYPSGLKGEDIPLAARIFAVADVYDALTSKRPYREAWSRRKALDYIKSLRGEHFDPQIVDIFCEFLHEEGIIQE